MECQRTNALETAIPVLTKHHADFVQMPHVAKVVKHVMQAQEGVLQGVGTEAQKQAVLSLKQTGFHQVSRFAVQRSIRHFRTDARDVPSNMNSSRS